MKEVLVGILRTGENEFERCIRALDEQTIRHDLDVEIIENVPNKEAHDRLYRMFMQRADGYHRFLKLDADMVLSSPHSLADMIEQMENLDHVMFDVDDWASGLAIPGIQMFTSNVRWGENPDPLMVDHAPKYEGAFERIKDGGFVSHMPDPTSFQAFRFGLHRMIKAIQPDRRQKNVAKAMMQWTILKNVWRRFEAMGDERRLDIIMGAEAVVAFRDPSLLQNYSGLSARLYWKRSQQTTVENKERILAKRFGNEIASDEWWMENMINSYWLPEEQAA